MQTHGDRFRIRWLALCSITVIGLVLAACAPAATPSPTAAPVKPTEAAKPAPEAAKPAAEAPKPAEAAKPAAQPTAAPAVDFRGKTIRLIVGYPPGGGFDANARILSPYLQQALPGNPTIVVENSPGADSLIAAKTVLTGPQRPDEINIVVYIATLLAKSQLSGGVDGFSPEKESAFIGKPDAAPTTLALCANKSAVKDMDSFLNRSQPIKVASTTGGSTYDVYHRWAKEVGYPIDIVFGYAGTANMILAFNQNEVDAVSSCRDVDLQQNPDWLENDILVPLIYWHEAADTLKKLQAQGKFPWFKHATEAKPITPEQKSTLLTWNDINQGTNIYAMSKQTPAPTVAAIQQGFKAAATNPAFVAEMDRRGLNPGYMGPEGIEKTIKDMDTATQAAKDLMKLILGV